MNSEETKPIPAPPLRASSLSGRFWPEEDVEALRAEVRRMMAIDRSIIESLSLERNKLFQELHEARQNLHAAQQPKTKGKVKRGAADKSFREVSPSGQWESNLAYTISQAAEYLQYSEDLVLKLCKDRTFKSTQRENAYRIKGSVILEYLAPK